MGLFSLFKKESAFLSAFRQDVDPNLSSAVEAMRALMHVPDAATEKKGVLDVLLDVVKNNQKNSADRHFAMHALLDVYGDKMAVDVPGGVDSYALDALGHVAKTKNDKLRNAEIFQKSYHLFTLKDGLAARKAPDKQEREVLHDMAAVVPQDAIQSFMAVDALEHKDEVLLMAFCNTRPDIITYDMVKFLAKKDAGTVLAYVEQYPAFLDTETLEKSLGQWKEKDVQLLAIWDQKATRDYERLYRNGSYYLYRNGSYYLTRGSEYRRDYTDIKKIDTYVHAHTNERSKHHDIGLKFMAMASKSGHLMSPAIIDVAIDMTACCQKHERKQHENHQDAMRKAGSSRMISYLSNSYTKHPGVFTSEQCAAIEKLDQTPELEALVSRMKLDNAFGENRQFVEANRLIMVNGLKHLKNA